MHSRNVSYDVPIYGCRRWLNLIETVTMGIAKEVQRLQDLGMNRILVNNVHPLGCTPFRTRPNNYTHCDDVANAVAAAHNKLLAEKLGNYRGNVMLLDLNTAFSRVVQPNPSMSLLVGLIMLSSISMYMGSVRWI